VRWNAPLDSTEAKAISAEEAETKITAYREASDGLRAAEAALKAVALDVEFCSVPLPINGRVSRERSRQATT